MYGERRRPINRSVGRKAAARHAPDWSICRVPGDLSRILSLLPPSAGMRLIRALRADSCARSAARARPLGCSLELWHAEV